MAITAVLLLALYAALAGWMSVWANRRFSRHARLPMQWWLSGQPTWYAPRRLALTLLPVLSGAGLIAGAVGMVAAPERSNLPPDDTMALVAGLGVFGLALYAGYLWAVERWDRAAV